MANTIWMEAGSQATYGLEFWTSTAQASSSSAVTRNGPRSLLVTTSNPAVTGVARKAGVLSDAGRRISCWVNLPSVAPVATAPLVAVQNAALVGIARVSLLTTGKLQANGVGASTVDGTTTLLANIWYRITFCYTITNATTFEIRVYLNGLLEITISNNGTLTNITTDTLAAQSPAAAGVNFLVYYSDIYVDDGANLADPGNIGVTYKAPAANDVNNFNTAIGANPANRWTNVNERPLSLTNGWQDSSVTSQKETYGLQTASKGDADITNATIVSRMAWIWAKQETAILGSPLLWDNGSSSAITLTTSAALYTHITDGNTYPSNATGVGMTSAGSAVDKTDFYECGTLIAYIPSTAKPSNPAAILGAA